MFFQAFLVVVFWFLFVYALATVFTRMTETPVYYIVAVADEDNRPLHRDYISYDG